MPDSTETPKDRIDKKAKHAIAKIDELKASTESQDLQLGLEEVKSDLQYIAMDPHKAQ
jgi:hypothetical protein